MSKRINPIPVFMVKPPADPGMDPEGAAREMESKRALCRHEAEQKLLDAEDSLLREGLQPLMEASLVNATSFMVNSAGRALLTRLGVDPDKRMHWQDVAGGPTCVVVGGRVAWFLLDGRDTAVSVFGARVRL
jgi:hypothetical protein